MPQPVTYSSGAMASVAGSSWQIVFGRFDGAKCLRSSLHSAAGLSDQVAQLPSDCGLRRTMGHQKVAHLGMKSILAGTMATCMTGAIAGLLSWPQGGWMNPPGMALAVRLPRYGKSDHWCRPSESQVRAWQVYVMERLRETGRQ